MNSGAQTNQSNVVSKRLRARIPGMYQVGVDGHGDASRRSTLCGQSPTDESGVHVAADAVRRGDQVHAAYERRAAEQRAFCTGPKCREERDVCRCDPAPTGLYTGVAVDDAPGDVHGKPTREVTRHWCDWYIRYRAGAAARTWRNGLQRDCNVAVDDGTDRRATRQRRCHRSIRRMCKSPIPAMYRPNLGLFARRFMFAPAHLDVTTRPLHVRVHSRVHARVPRPTTSNAPAHHTS